MMSSRSRCATRLIPLLAVVTLASPVLAEGTPACAAPAVVSDLTPADSFSEVRTSAGVPVEIVVRPGGTRVSLCASPAVAGRMRIRVVDHRLLLEDRGGVRKTEGDRLIVTVSQIDVVEVRSGSPVSVRGGTAPLRVDALGPGPVSIVGNGGGLKLRAFGDGPVTVSGLANPLDVQAAGSGPMNLVAVRDATGVVDHVGGGPMILPITSRLRVTGNGTGPVIRR